MLAKEFPEIKMAKKQLEVLSHNAKAKAIYEARQKALHEKVSSLNYMYSRGFEKGEKKKE